MREKQLADVQLSPVIKHLEQGEPLPASLAPGLRRTFIQDGVLCRSFQLTSSSNIKAQLVIPSDLRNTVLQQLHNNAGHLGIRKTMDSVKERFYWPGYELNIEKWVRECQQCQRHNPPNPAPLAPLGTIKANSPFEKISWDIDSCLRISYGTLYAFAMFYAHVLREGWSRAHVRDDLYPICTKKFIIGSLVALCMLDFCTI